MFNIGRTNGIPNKINFGSFSDFFADGVVEAMSQKLNGGSCPEIGASDADNQKNIGIFLDFAGSFFDSGKFFLVVIYRQINPAKEIVAGACFGNQYFFCIHSQLLHGVYFMLLNEGGSLGIIKCDFVHNDALSFCY